MLSVTVTAAELITTATGGLLTPDKDRVERAWVQAACRGDQAAFARIVRRYQGPVFRQCTRYLNRAEAEEVTQDTFVRAFTNLERFDPSRPLFPWLYTIAKRLCLDRIRRRRAHPSDTLEAQVADNRESPERGAANRQLMAVLRRVLAELPEGQREAVSLFHIEGLAYKEIAQVLEVPMGTVMTWIHRGRRRIRDELASAGAGSAL